MSRMTKGRDEASQVDTTRTDAGTGTGSHRGSHRRLRVSELTESQNEPTLLAFADALRDILHDELRATG